MKKMISILLTLLLLCGCTAVSEQTTEPNQNTESNHQTAVPTSPAQPGCSLVEYDPERQIYIDFTNVDRDIYRRHSWSPILRFRVYSLEPLDRTQISVHLPIHTSYRLATFDQIGPSGERDLAGQYLDYYYPNYLFAQYCGVDWTDLEALTAIERDFRHSVWEMPEFYVYLVEIQLDKECYAESFQELELTIGSQVYPVHFGEIRLHPDAQCDVAQMRACNDYVDAMKFFWSEPDEPWGSGLLETTLCTLNALDDVTINSLTLLETEREILDVFVQIYTEDGGGFNYAWSMEDPIYLNKGEEIWITVRFREDAARELNYVTAINSIMEITHPAGTGYIFFETLLERANNDYEMYAIVFDGLDMESYYRDYYYAQPSWRDEYLTEVQP